MSSEAISSVQAFGRKKTAIAVAHCKYGHGVMKLNGQPIDVMQPECMRMKAIEPVLLLGADRFANLDIRITVKGGGRVAQIYAVRQAISRAIVAFYQKYVDEQAKREIKDLLISFDRSLIASDPRRTEPKKYGGPSARARYQKSYR